MRSEGEARWLIVIAASSGGLTPLGAIVAALPGRIGGAVIVVQHRSAAVADVLPSILATRTTLRVETPGHGQPVLGGRVYVARPDLHLTIAEDRRFQYHDGARIQGARSAADPLLASAARAYGAGLIAVVLSGRGRDGSDAIGVVRALGGTVVAQAPETASSPEMPAAAIATHLVHHVVPFERLGTTVAALIRDLDAVIRDGAA